MSYIKKVKQYGPEFKPLVRLIEHIRGGKYGDQKHPLGTLFIKDSIRVQHGIDIGDVIRTDDQVPYTPVDFGDEKNYLMFMLRWS